MDFGFLRIAAAIPSVQIAGCRHNVSRIEKLIRQAARTTGGARRFPGARRNGIYLRRPFHPTRAARRSGKRIGRSAEIDLRLPDGLHCRHACGRGQPTLQYGRRLLPGTRARNRTENLSSQLRRVLRESLVRLGSRPRRRQRDAMRAAGSDVDGTAFRR